MGGGCCKQPTAVGQVRVENTTGFFLAHLRLASNRYCSLLEGIWKRKKSPPTPNLGTS